MAWIGPLAAFRPSANQQPLTMIKRLVIAAIIVGLFLGGVGYFNLVFKPQMIGEFM